MCNGQASSHASLSRPRSTLMYLRKYEKETMIACTGVLKCLHIDVVWSVYAQVYVQYYSSAVVETTFVGVYSIPCTQYQWIIDPFDSLYICTTQQSDTWL